MLVLAAVLLIATNALATPTAHLTLHSQPGDFIGGGVDSDFIYTQPTSVLSAQAFGIPPTELVFVMFPFVPPSPTNDFLATLSFGTTQLGIPIQAGSYFDAQRSPASGHPHLDITFNHHGCNTATGNFTMTDVGFLTGNVVNSFTGSFEQHCEGAAPALFGTFTYSLSGTTGSGLVGLVLWRRKHTA